MLLDNSKTLKSFRHSVCCYDPRIVQLNYGQHFHSVLFGLPNVFPEISCCLCLQARLSNGHVTLLSHPLHLSLFPRYELLDIAHSSFVFTSDPIIFITLLCRYLPDWHQLTPKFMVFSCTSSFSVFKKLVFFFYLIIYHVCKSLSLEPILNQIYTVQIITCTRAILCTYEWSMILISCKVDYIGLI
jgi:hypothetical protein